MAYSGSVLSVRKTTKSSEKGPFSKTYPIGKKDDVSELADDQMKKLNKVKEAGEEFDSCCASFVDSLGKKEFSWAKTKLRKHMSKEKKTFRNLEGIVAIQVRILAYDTSPSAISIRIYVHQRQ